MHIFTRYNNTNLTKQKKNDVNTVGLRIIFIIYFYEILGNHILKVKKKKKKYRSEGGLPPCLQSTQWDDIQRKLGNLPPKPPPFKPPDFAPAEDEDLKPKGKAWNDQKTEDELEDLEDDLDDDRFLQEYRKKRLSEMRESAKIVRFGSVIPISGSDFVREVSQAQPDVWVVVMLFKDGYPECRLLLQCLEQLATRYPATKFVKIISTECIPNYPDCNLPTLLVYNNSAVKATHVGVRSFGRRSTPESVALVLCQRDPVLNDGHGGEQSREAVLDEVRKKLVERVVRDHVDDDDDGSSNE